MEVHKSDVVISLKGRDSGERFMVLDDDKNFLYLVNGKSRRVEAPKKKKRKHVKFVSRIDEATALRLAAKGKITNSEVRKVLTKMVGDQTLVVEGGI